MRDALRLGTHAGEPPQEPGPQLRQLLVPRRRRGRTWGGAIGRRRRQHLPLRGSIVTRRALPAAPGRGLPRGRAVQVDPMKPVSKAPRTMLLKQICNEPLSNFAFNVHLRRYTEGAFHRVVPSGTQMIDFVWGTCDAAPRSGSWCEAPSFDAAGMRRTCGGGGGGGGGSSGGGGGSSGGGGGDGGGGGGSSSSSSHTHKHRPQRCRNTPARR